jgi:hypothetical protein
MPVMAANGLDAEPNKAEHPINTHEALRDYDSWAGKRTDLNTRCNPEELKAPREH